MKYWVCNLWIAVKSYAATGRYNFLLAQFSARYHRNGWSRGEGNETTVIIGRQLIFRDYSNGSKENKKR